MRILVKENPRTIALASKNHALLFRQIQTSKAAKRCMIEFLPLQDINLRQFRNLSNRDIQGFLGLIEVENDYFICSITGTNQVATPVPNQTINRIYNVDFFSINNPQWDFIEFDSNGYPILPEMDPEEEKASGQYQKHPCTDLKKLLSTGGFYYSSDFDLTTSLQTRGIASHSLSFDNFKQEYMWNSFMLDEITKFRNKLEPQFKELLDDEGFLTTVIRGFAETFQTDLKGKRALVTIISRQSWKRAGTRFNSRGIDDDAYVSNFVETEYIMYSSKIAYSYLQIRGSVPIFWEQDTSLINAKISITRSEEATQPIFNQHFERLIDNYGNINIVNLLNKDKSSEYSITQRYRYHYEQARNANIQMTEFDFHRETSNQGYSSSNKIYSLIKEQLFNFGFYSYNLDTNEVISEQTGIFRTNCLDCLDRTNLIQQFISNFALTIFLKNIETKISQESDFFLRHNALWADNGDQISQIYTGTNALKSSFSRNGGKMSFAMKLSDATKSVSRLYINNFQDKGKQFNIDMLLGRLNGQVPVILYDPITDYVNDELVKLKSDYCYYDGINLFVGTFNVNAFDNFRNVDLTGWLFPIGNKFQPNIVVLGLQEVIELTAGSILNADYSKTKYWTKEVLKCLNQFDSKYVMLRAEQMSSLLILFFVKSDNVENVKQVEGAIRKTGLGGITGNKGAVAIRFNYGSSKFCFVNVHLAAGTSNIQERNNDFNNILNGINFSRSGKIEDNDNIIWLGDMNYRLNLENFQVRDLIESGSFEELIKHDQLTHEIQSKNSFIDYQEASVNFRPTYKYDKGSNRYDSSEKLRTPSWTDRIIYKYNEGLKPWAYQSSDSIMISDHKPVYFAAKCKVEFVDQDKKLALTKKLVEKYKQLHGDDHIKITIIESQSFEKKGNVPPATPLRAEINLMDDSYKPELPSRRDTITPLKSSAKNKEIIDENLATISSSSLSPPPFASSSSSSSQTSHNVPPPIPSPRKQLPPGYNSDFILQPKSKSGTPSRTNTPTESLSGNSSRAARDNVDLSNESHFQSTEKKPAPPLIPKKPENLRSVSTISTISTNSSVNVSIREKAPVPPPSRKSAFDSGMDMNNWQPLIPGSK
ncbi:hypothetical protein WICMUC_001731 [Wickerhamomyces mucosus]|uniref:phosphoinositide 5-phosphatase n=1 Tax=Wickerhamomyces mucosus TaxID=1378264 RepID=A0A9P8TFG7_9ASCO|nr:hypothetical protein WICMUC_001731 [Wickerhamomyces mucosus]